MMKLLGSPTSPFARKIRILLNAIGESYEFVDTRTPEGAKTLAAHAPLAKVPVLVVDSELVIPDSSLIAAWLWAKQAQKLAAAGFSLEPTAFEDRARQVLVEGAIDALINHRYLTLEGVPEQGYVLKQKQRAERTLSALEGAIPLERPLGFAALSLGVTLDWIAFRKPVDLARWPGLVAFREAWIASGVGAGTEPKE